MCSRGRAAARRRRERRGQRWSRTALPASARAASTITATPYPRAAEPERLVMLHDGAMVAVQMNGDRAAAAEARVLAAALLSAELTA